MAMRWWAGERKEGEEAEMAGPWRQYALIKVNKGQLKGREEPPGDQVRGPGEAQVETWYW